MMKPLRHAVAIDRRMTAHPPDDKTRSQRRDDKCHQREPNHGALMLPFSQNEIETATGRNVTNYRNNER